MIDRIHHINFLVRDLDKAIPRFRDDLGLGKPIIEDLAGRAVRTARFRLAGTWLILVEPLDDHSAPAQHLAKHGEGFFLLSLGCDDLDSQISAIEGGSELSVGAERRGLEGWRVADLSADDFNGVQLQLAQDSDERERTT